MLQKLLSRPSLRRITLQATRDEVTKLLRRRRRSFGRLSHTYSTHQTRPVTLSTHSEREPPQVKLQDANTETPYIPRVTVVTSVIQVRVDPLGAHVSDGSHRGVARIHGLRQDPAHPEVSDLDVIGRVYEKVRGFDVAVDDVTAVDISQAAENLAREVSELVFPRRVFAFEGAFVHELEKDLDLAVVIEHVVAFHDVGVVNAAQDLDLSADLAPHVVVVVPVDHLESEETGGGTVDHFVDRSSGAASDSVHAL